MPKILIATNNPGKIEEFTELLSPHGLTIVTPKQIGIKEQPPEDGETFAENSLLKANFYWQNSDKIDTLADDGGLMIDALGGQPGAHTRRIDGKERSDEELRKIVLKKIASVPAGKRTARLTAVVTLRVGQDLNFQTEASIEGMIKESKLPYSPGYPLRSILWIPSCKKFFSELTPDEYRSLSHRRKAIDKLLPYLEQYVL